MTADDLAKQGFDQVQPKYSGVRTRRDECDYAEIRYKHCCNMYDQMGGLDICEYNKTKITLIQLFIFFTR